MENMLLVGSAGKVAPGPVDASPALSHPTLYPVGA